MGFVWHIQKIYHIFSQNVCKILICITYLLNNNHFVWMKVKFHVQNYTDTSIWNVLRRPRVFWPNSVDSFWLLLPYFLFSKVLTVRTQLGGFLFNAEVVCRKFRTHEFIVLRLGTLAWRIPKYLSICETVVVLLQPIDCF